MAIFPVDVESGLGGFVAQEIFINVSPMESRVALLDNGVLQEVHFERVRQRGLLGNIYKGKVVRVLPGMQAAFVEVGLARSAFIHASDFFDNQVDDNSEATPIKPIEALVKEGDTLLVQIIKDPIGTKGARLTSALSIASRYVVLMPKSERIGISLRVEDEAERTRLRSTIETIKEEEEIEGFGFIVRTAAEDVGERMLKEDILFLIKLYQMLEKKIAASPVPSLVHEDLPLHKKVFRDMVHEEIERIRIDSKICFQDCVSFANDMTPALADRVELYDNRRPLFDIYGVEDEITRALQPKIELKSGGYIVIDQTEAMTTVDVNTGSFTGHNNFEETILKTNLDSAVAIARQIRLRNLGGMIIVDFIDMKEEEHRRMVQVAFMNALEQDHAKVRVSGISELGLVEMTRKRTRESLGNSLTEFCEVCQGRGRVKSKQTVCFEIFRELIRNVKNYDTHKFTVLAAESVIDRLLDEESEYLADLESFLGSQISLQVESSYFQEDFDVVPV